MHICIYLYILSHNISQSTSILLDFSFLLNQLSKSNIELILCVPMLLLILMLLPLDLHGRHQITSFLAELFQYYNPFNSVAAAAATAPFSSNPFDFLFLNDVLATAASSSDISVGSHVLVGANVADGGYVFVGKYVGYNVGESVRGSPVGCGVGRGVGS